MIPYWKAAPAQPIKRAEIGGKKTQAGDPSGHFAPGHEIVFAGIGPSLQIETDAQNQSEIEDDDDGVHRRQIHQLRGHNLRCEGGQMRTVIDRDH
jgi:hypothetical protein